MKTLLLAALVLLCGGFARAAGPRENAERAQALLGPHVWSRLIRIENSNRHSEYPRRVFATVFELAGCLWFYTDENGTQSLSLRGDNLKVEKEDLGPLLKALDPGFCSFAVLNEGASRSAVPDGRLLNGCFVESVAALRVRSEAGVPVERAQLFAFYLPERLGGRGHTVLTYEASGLLNVVDMALSPKARQLPLECLRDPVSLAASLASRPIARTRFLPLGAFTFTGWKWVGPEVDSPSENSSRGPRLSVPSAAHPRNV